ncbi:hypothetical protein ACQEVI_26300 [Promicromonospora sp. CA-289599]|uniref:hypothetical protein n=1 Tax=Promicromonospora sp. CA-289599 TaxID=3240014 RepID=UPI003D8A91FD
MSLSRFWENFRYRTLVRGVPSYRDPEPYAEPHRLAGLADQLRNAVRSAADRGALDAGNAGDFDSDIDAAAKLDRIDLKRQQLQRRAVAARTQQERAHIATEAEELARALENRVTVLNSEIAEARTERNAALKRWRAAQRREWRSDDKDPAPTSESTSEEARS